MRKPQIDRYAAACRAAARVRLSPMSGWTVDRAGTAGGADRGAVDRLRQVCEAADPLDLKLELDESDVSASRSISSPPADGEVIGYAAMTADADAEACGMVHPAWRRRGVGTALLDELRAAARRPAAREHPGDLRGSRTGRARLDAPARRRRLAVWNAAWSSGSARTAPGTPQVGRRSRHSSSARRQRRPSRRWSPCWERSPTERGAGGATPGSWRKPRRR